MPDYVATIAVHVLADNEEQAKALLNRLIKVSYRFKYMIEADDDE